MFKAIRDSWSLFERHEQREIYLVLVLQVFVAIFEVIGIASITPFLAVLSDPEEIQSRPILVELSRILSPTSSEVFLFQLGILVLFTITLTNLLNAFSVWVLQRFVWLRYHTLSLRLLKRYLRQPWSFFLNRNSSELAANILSEASQFITQYVMAGMQLLANGLAGLLIAVLLLIVDPMLASIVFTLVGGVYFSIFLLIRKTQLKMGQTRRASNEQRFSLATQALNGIKDIKIRGKEAHFVELFGNASRSFSEVQAKNSVIALTPRYFLEVLAFGAVMIIILYELRVRGTASNIIPTVGLYAFAGFRLLPKMQAMFHAGSNLRFSGEILQYLTHDLIGLRVHEEPNVEPAPKLQEEFELKDASFFYPNSSTKVLRDINLTIPRNRTVALVGATGSGKSTCLDILMGLHIPTSGCLQVDGNTLTPGSTLGWRTKCGYVPQTIFLTDESIEKNIAFGIPENEIEIAAVRRAARIANIDSFIESLPQSYQTEVGERGIRLSGGQRQRIGIARALYHDPDVLFFDEATSALDNATERSVMNAITELSGQKTMVIVAHRLDTIRLADKICVLDNGRLVGEGPWEELSHNCPTFQNLLNSMEKEEK